DRGNQLDRIRQEMAERCRRYAAFRRGEVFLALAELGVIKGIDPADELLGAGYRIAQAIAQLRQRGADQLRAFGEDSDDIGIGLELGRTQFLDQMFNRRDDAGDRLYV